MPSTTDEEQLNNGLFGLFKGESGAGKSVGALSFPNPYVFDCDRKMPAIAKKHFPGKKVDWDTFTDIFKLAEVLVKFNNYCEYETLILDSITSLSALALNSIDLAKGTNVVQMIQNIKNTKGGTKTIELRGYDYYNGEDGALKYVLDMLKMFHVRPGNPKHVIVLAHVLETESAPDIKTKVVTKTRRIVTAGRGIAAYIPAQFDDIWFFGTEPPEFGSDDKTIKHYCLTESGSEDSAKTAYRLERVIDFTNANLYEKIKNVIDPTISVNVDALREVGFGN